MHLKLEESQHPLTHLLFDEQLDLTLLYIILPSLNYDKQLLEVIEQNEYYQLQHSP